MATEEQTIADDSNPQQVDGQISEQLGIDAPDSTFSLELSQDQKDIREWAHGFAEQTVRPAAQEWDEKEEFPWPIVQEAAKIGLYGFEVDRPVLGRPLRAHLPDRQRGALLGRRRDRHVDLRHHARGRRHLRLGHARADGRVGAAVLRHRRRRQGRGLLRLRARRRLRRLRLPDHRQVRRGQGRVGAQRPEGLGDQRRHRQRPRGDRLGRPRARLARPRRLRRPARDQGPRAGRQGEEARHPRLAHRRRPPRRLPHPRLLPARRQGEARRAARQGARGQELQGPGRDADLRALAADGRRAGGRHRPRRLRVRARLRQGARGVRAARSSRTRRSPSPSPT